VMAPPPPPAAYSPNPGQVMPPPQTAAPTPAMPMPAPRPMMPSPVSVGTGPSAPPVGGLGGMREPMPIMDHGPMGTGWR
jgi:hypothetical protein